jgi:hypothetical protein
VTISHFTSQLDAVDEAIAQRSRSAERAGGTEIASIINSDTYPETSPNGGNSAPKHLSAQRAQRNVAVTTGAVPCARRHPPSADWPAYCFRAGCGDARC